MLMPMLWNRTNDDWFDFGDTFDAMDRMMNNYFGNDTLETTHGMKTDVLEDEKSYKLEAELPGFNKEDIHVDMKDGVLTIAAAHNENKDEKTGKYIRRERRSSSYQRSFRVQEGVTPEDISAKYENGVLTLTVPKKEALPEKEQVKQIAIQ